MLECSPTSSMMSFTLPSQCPADTQVMCTYQQEGMESSPLLKDYSDEPEEDPPIRKARIKRGPAFTPEVEPAVRRSPRIKDRNAGFKQSVYANKNCFACSITPTAISTSNMKALG
ncbi:hypothetical protein SEVIR_7G068462v4 [Setaria viridis]